MVLVGIAESGDMYRVICVFAVCSQYSRTSLSIKTLGLNYVTLFCIITVNSDSVYIFCTIPIT